MSAGALERIIANNRAAEQTLQALTREVRQNFQDRKQNNQIGF